MITKIFHKKVYFVLLFCIFICGFYFNSLIVNADTNPSECSVGNIYSRVNPSFDINGNVVTIKLNGSSNYSINLGSKDFKLIQVYAYHASDNKTSSISGDGANDGTEISQDSVLVPDEIITKITDGYYKDRNLYRTDTIQNTVYGFGSKFTGYSLKNKVGASISVNLTDVLNAIDENVANKTAFRFIFKRDADSNGGSCKDAVYFYVDVDGLNNTPIEENVEVKGLANDGKYSSGVNCDNPDGEFEERFCRLKKMYFATVSVNGTVDINNYDLKKNPDLLNNINDKESGTYKGLKCDSSRMIQYNEVELSSDNYYSESKILYGYKDEVSESDLYYQYHYDSVSEPVIDKIDCSKRCEEVVEVKYGPPVAAMAGVCIQYKVKVISRVVCSTNGEVKKPRDTGLTVYSPVPYCISGGAVYNQGGPSASFDKCIDNCDGGKYSLSCSKKCLKEVYGSKNKTSNDSANTSVASKLAVSSTDLGNCAKRTVKAVCNSSDYNFNTEQKNECLAYFKAKGLDPDDNVNGYGCYYRNGNSTGWYGLETEAVANNYPNRSLYVDGMVNFSPWQNANDYVPGRWYIMRKLGGWGLGGYYYKVWDTGGIYRASYGGYACGDYCYWGSVPANTYINNDYVYADYIYNKNTFEKAKIACSSQATCSTTVSEYTISADTKTISKGNIETKTYNFPIGGNDKLDYKDSQYNEDGTFDREKTSLISDAIDIKDTTYNKGCYVKNHKSENENRYRATWTFPGVTMDIKNGLVYYDADLSKINANNLHFEKEKFCIPKTATSVNKEWMLYFYNKLYNKGTSMRDNNSGIKIIKDEKCDKTCAAAYEFLDSTYENYNRDEFEKSGKIDWNINASTRNFGYFNWNIDISCFYGISIDGTNSKKDTDDGDGSCSNACDPSNPDNYRIRAVDFENMFPSTDGSHLTDSTATGRTPGFNWSVHADTSALIDSGKKDGNGNTIYKNANNPYFALNPENYVKYLQGYAKTNSTIYTEDLLDYEFDLSTADLRTLRNKVDKEGHNVLNYKGNAKVVNGVSRYVSPLIHDNTLKNKRVPKADLGENAKNKNSAIRCNNMENYKSTDCVKFTEGGNKTNE